MAYLVTHLDGMAVSHFVLEHESSHRTRSITMGSLFHGLS